MINIFIKVYVDTVIKIQISLVIMKLILTTRGIMHNVINRYTEILPLNNFYPYSISLTSNQKFCFVICFKQLSLVRVNLNKRTFACQQTRLFKSPIMCPFIIQLIMSDYVIRHGEYIAFAQSTVEYMLLKILSNYY